MADNNLQLTTNITQSSLSAAVSSSVPSSKPAMSLEARAAQLREKLIRSREKSRARTTKETETPAPLTTAADTRPIHHQQPPQNSFVPDADDVAELISSFSSAEPSSFSGVLALGSSISPTKPPGSLRLQKAPSNQVGESAKSSSNQPPASHLEVSLEEGEKSIHSGHDSAAASKPVINMPGRASTLSDESPQPTSVANGKKMWKDDYQEAPQASGETLPVLSPADVMQRLLKQVPDLSDWLELTEYHDAESRAKKLDRYRRAKQIAAKRKEIEEEERKLMEEEVREKEMQRTRAANVTSPNIAASLLMSAIPNPPGAMNDRPSRKRSYNDDGDRERRGKAYRSGHGPSRAHERRRTYDSYWDGEDREYPYRRY